MQADLGLGQPQTDLQVSSMQLTVLLRKFIVCQIAYARVLNFGHCWSEQETLSELSSMTLYVPAIPLLCRLRPQCSLCKPKLSSNSLAQREGQVPSHQRPAVWQTPLQSKLCFRSPSCLQCGRAQMMVWQGAEHGPSQHHVTETYRSKRSRSSCGLLLLCLL